MTVLLAAEASPTSQVVVSATSQPLKINGTLAVSGYASINRVAAASAVDVAIFKVTVLAVVFALMIIVRMIEVWDAAGFTKSAADVVNAVVAFSWVGTYVAILFTYSS